MSVSLKNLEECYRSLRHNNTYNEWKEFKVMFDNREKMFCNVTISSCSVAMIFNICAIGSQIYSFTIPLMIFLISYIKLSISKYCS